MKIVRKSEKKGKRKVNKISEKGLKVIKKRGKKESF